MIASGSLLGIDYKRASSYPVGYVDYMKMYGIDFEEFLWGMGITDDMISSLCSYLDSKKAIPEAIHSKMMSYYRQYVAIGGMPEAVQKFIDTRDFREIDRIQRSLLQGYQYDIAHYATAEEKIKAEKCYLSLARQLLDKENHKFQYKEGEVIPIEVKSSNTRANSLKALIKNNKEISYGYKFIDGNIGISDDGIISLPLYMVAFL